MSIAENIAQVKANIERAALAAGRDPKEILLVGATKMNDASRVKEAIAAGLPCCGENRVQELLEKNEAGAYEGAQLHFIGTLQKNKAKYLVGLVSLIHSVDSIELMKEISRQAVKRGIRQDILIEVNTGGEASKSGLAPGELAEILEKTGEFPGIFVRGLMTIPPICRAPEENLPYFDLLRQLFIDNGEKKYDNVRMDFMSMGMSGDYEAAIACGANIVRVGTAIFGRRHYPEKQA
ncbi:MAG: YggS family pyridoxal phosphate-dependent enzyme [Oscillospiraceae bacterium]|nr:YggS family pyridoxal phosphate-dependent enzyme [Oscillospiraceae bacterium]